MSAAIPTFAEARALARRQKRVIVSRVLMADDSIRLVRIGPRGGWSFED